MYIVSVGVCIVDRDFTPLHICITSGCIECIVIESLKTNRAAVQRVWRSIQFMHSMQSEDVQRVWRSIQFMQSEQQRA